MKILIFSSSPNTDGLTAACALCRSRGCEAGWWRGRARQPQRPEDRHVPGLRQRLGHLPGRASSARRR